MWNESLEEKYDSLKRKYDRLYDSHEDLQSKLNKCEDKLSSAECRIRNELEPRIQSEREAYDSYVTNGGNDPCFYYGMSGKCGIECPEFCEHDSCIDAIDELTDDELLQYYAENDAFDAQSVIREILIERGLKEEIRDIDDEYCRSCIGDWSEKIDALKILISQFEEFLRHGYKE